MSIPSLVTLSTPHHHHYPHHHPQSPYNNQLGAYSLANGTTHLVPSYNFPNGLSSTSRPTPQTSSRQLPPPANMPTPYSASSLGASRSRNRHPDWDEYFKNGVPKEIVCVDTPSPEPPRKRTFGGGAQIALDKEGAGDTLDHAVKKRRTGQGAAYDTARDNYAAYSHGRTYSHQGSGSNTISTDRTTSLQTTAPTSLSSNGSAGAQYVDDTSIGQKRKRTTRQQVAEEKRRKDIDILGDPNSKYVPPPKPPIKAKEVMVPYIRDTIRPHEKIDDDEGHYIVAENSMIGDRYETIRQLGQGTFGKVVEAYDNRKKTRVAIKIIRSVQKYRDASKIELRVLQTLAHNDEFNRNKCIHLRDTFDFRNHICIVTDLLGQSVFDFLKANQFVPFPSSQIQHFAKQLFTSVAFLHDLNLIHTDLKPENILLVNSNYQCFTYNRYIPSSSTTINRRAPQRRVLLDTEIRLIDFGSATFDDEYHSSVVSTRHYRAPEIILNLGWSYPCDIWSIGCILVEFYTGDALFQTHDNLEHLAMMENICGCKLEPKIVRAVQSGSGRSRNSAASYFKSTGRLDYPNKETNRASKKYVNAMKHLDVGAYTPQERAKLAHNQDIIPLRSAFNRQFVDLLRQVFVYDPKRRVTAKQALKHPWFKETIKDDGTEAFKIKLEKEDARNIVDLEDS